MATVAEQIPSKPSAAARLVARAYTLNWEVVGYMAIFVLVCFTRIYDLGTRAMSHDESLHTKFSWELYKDGHYAHNPMMHGPLLFHMTALSYFLFGDNDLTSRLYVAVLGIALVMLPVLYRRWLGRTAALLTSLMLLVSPYMMYYSRYIRHDIPVIFFALILFWALFSYLEDRRFRWLYVIGICLILMLASKEVAFIYVGIAGSFLLLLLLAQLIHHHTAINGRRLLETGLGGLIVGAVIAMGLIVVLTISPPNTWDQQAGYMMRAIVWSLGVIGAVVAFVIGVGILQFWRAGFERFPAGLVAALILLALFVAMVGVYLDEVTSFEQEATTSPAPDGEALPGADAGLVELLSEYGAMLLAAMLVTALVGGVAVLARLQGWWDQLTVWPSFDVLIIFATLILPWLMPLVVKAFGYNPTDYQHFWPVIFILAPAILLSVIIGVVWNWRWALVAGVFYGLFFFFFTTMFTNGQGLATGMVGSLGYWLAQHGVRRGQQPQFYYVLQVIFYEFLPLAGAAGAGVMGLNAFYRHRREDIEREAASHVEIDDVNDIEPGEQIQLQPKEPASLFDSAPVRVFFGYLLAANFIAYTLAGEKMPWLTSHLVVPMVFLAGWFFGRVINDIEWARFRRGGWLLLVLIPLIFVSGVRAIGGVFDPVNGPFRGLEQAQLANTGAWFVALITLLGTAAAGIWVVRQYAGWQHLARMVIVVGLVALVLITARSAWMAAFINYDLANEFLVYAHSAPAVKEVMTRIEEISRQTTDSLNIPVVYDNEVSWPYSWYFRNYPKARFGGSNPSHQMLEEAYVVLIGENNLGNLDAAYMENRFYQYDMIRLWWPIQDYFHIDVDKIDKLFALNAEGAALRQGLFDIWWNRDYDRYALATGRDPSRFSLDNWPVRDRMSFFVRKDIAAQVWDYGVGDESVFDVTLEDPYATNAFVLMASESIGEAAGLSAPRALDIDSDGNLYVADSENHRILILDPDGKPVRAFGGLDLEAEEARPGYFRQPWGVDVAPNGTIFVADTWNHRVQAFTPEGEFITMWGHRGDPDDPYGFYGPREIAALGDRVFVTDTGNKLIRVYTYDGEWLYNIGGGGSEPGYLEEPVGLALGNNEVIVADTWNRRAQVFSTTGEYLRHWALNAWHSPGNLPFLTRDDRSNVYIGDPDTCRVLVYDIAGEYRYNFGRCSETPVTLSDFGTVSGMTIGDEYQLYIADAEADRILRFDLRHEPIDDTMP